MRSRKLGTLTALCVIGLSAKGHAAGQELPALGSQAIGRGSAFTAKADNPSAFYFLQCSGTLEGEGRGGTGIRQRHQNASPV
ncbi:MAG: hypothetical protein HRU17_24380 [Polyangiaceae bacterium]|nr:hypothetical protein [Polyangiaceae bacterium]